MVALESAAANGHPKPPRAQDGFVQVQVQVWTLAAGAVLLVGLGLRFALGGGGVGDRSAMVMATLLSVGVWLATRLLSTPRTACLVALGVIALLDLAALPARNAPEYDYREAFYRTDQVVSAQIPVVSGFDAARVQPILEVLVEAVFPSDAATDKTPFGLAGEVGGATLVWDCAFQRGLQHLALPVPPAAIAGAAPLDVRLHLTGSPTRESAYLLVYASAPRGGFLVSLIDAGNLRPGETVCTLHL